MTPYTQEGLRKYDHMNPIYAAVLAWNEPGPNPVWHAEMRRRVEKAMPLLARALDRLSGEEEGQ